MRYSHLLLVLLDTNADAIKLYDYFCSRAVRQVGR
jgi:hypothetical protein